MLRTVKNIGKRFLSKNKEDSQLAVLPSYNNVKFIITCDVERYRIEKYGGEQEALDYFLKICRESLVIYDIGASVGLYTIISAKSNSKAKVYSFEPDPETYLRLNENIKINELKNIRTINKACSDKLGNVELFTDGVAGFAPTLSQQKNRIGAPENSVIIKSGTIDTIISDELLPLPDIIKIDIEGAEMIFLKGAKNLLSGGFGMKPNDIFVELHPIFLKDFKSDLDEVYSLFMEYGYRLIWERKREEQIHCHYQLISKS